MGPLGDRVDGLGETAPFSGQSVFHAHRGVGNDRALDDPLLFELLQANFPNSFSILLGLAFLVIVYFVPNGIAGLIARGSAATAAAARRRAQPAE